MTAPRGGDTCAGHYRGAAAGAEPPPPGDRSARLAPAMSDFDSNPFADPDLNNPFKVSAPRRGVLGVGLR